MVAAVSKPSIQSIPQKRTFYPYTTTAKSAQTYLSGELLLIKWKNYLQIHGTAMGTKMAGAFSNIFIAKVETDILNQSALKPLVWKRFIDDIFSLWNTTREEVTQFIEQANKRH